MPTEQQNRSFIGKRKRNNLFLYQFQGKIVRIEGDGEEHEVKGDELDHVIDCMIEAPEKGYTVDYGATLSDGVVQIEIWVPK